MVSDNGPQFISADFAEFARTNGIRHIRSSPYHPSSNGEAERFVRTFKEAMKTGKSDGLTLTHRLQNFLLSYRTTPHTTTGTPPSELLMGRHLRTRWDLLRPDVERQVQWRQSKQKDRHDLHARPRCFSVGQSVMARNFRAGAAWVPGVIVQQLGPLTYLIEVSEGRLWKRHIDQVKQYLIQGPLAEAGELDTPRSTREVPESDQGHVPETVELQEPEIQSELVPNAAPPHGETPVPSQATVPATPVVLPTTPSPRASAGSDHTASPAPSSSRVAPGNSQRKSNLGKYPTRTHNRPDYFHDHTW